MRRAAAFLVLTALVGCGGSAGPSVVATPEPVPATAPPVTAPVVSNGCGLPRATGIGRDCPRLKPSFDGEVDTAIQATVDAHPEWFDFRRARGSPTSYRVVVAHAYYDSVVENLKKQGLCALDDGREVGVKNDNSFSDHYQILSSDSFIIRGLASYRSTCYPAWDAIP